MKKISLLILLLFTFYSVKSQDGEINYINIEAPLVHYIDWGDPIYNSFFTSGGLKSTAEDIMIFPIQRYNQADSRWGNNPIANSCSNCVYNGTPYGVIVNGAATTRCAIRSIGCLLTCETMLLSYWGYNFTPGSWNDYLKRSDFNGFSGCLLKPNNMYRYTHNPSSTYVSLQFSVNYYGSSDDTKVTKILKAVIDQLFGLVIVKVNKIGRIDGTIGNAPGGHFIVIYGYKTTDPTLKDFIISDPGTSYDDILLENSHVYRTLGDYYTGNVSPLFITTPGVPTIRFFRHGMYFYTDEATINFPQPSYETGQTLSLSVPSSSKKSTTSRLVVWTIKEPNGLIVTGTEETFNYFLYEPGEYTLTLAVKDGNEINSDIKTFNVTGRCIPRSCKGYDISNIRITSWDNKVKFAFNYAEGHLVADEVCNWLCSVPAMWLKKSGYSQQIRSYEYGGGQPWYFEFYDLDPNAYYILKSSNVGYHCGLFSCGFEDDEFFNDCHWEILTSPNNITRNTDISSYNTFEDDALYSIKFTPGFKYRASNNYKYSAKIVSGPNVMRYCGSGDYKKSTSDVNNGNDEANIDTIYYIKNEIIQHCIDEAKIVISPNPSKGIFKILINHYNIDETINVSITNISGLVIFNRSLFAEKNIIDLSKQAKGIYIITIKYHQQIFVDKIIIQ